MVSLKKYPMLALKNKTSEKILDALSILLAPSNQIAVVSLPPGKEFYRCRDWEDERSFGYPEFEMFQAPVGKSKMGRFNGYGVPVLYMSDSAEIAQKELGLTKENYTCMCATNNTELKVICIEKNINTFFNYCLKSREKPGDNDVWPDQYLLSNFVAQSCYYLITSQPSEIVGIQYQTTTGIPGYSYAFFTLSQKDFSLKNIFHHLW